MTCQIVSLIIQNMQQWWFDDGLWLKSVSFMVFNDFLSHFKGFHENHEYAN